MSPTGRLALVLFTLPLVGWLPTAHAQDELIGFTSPSGNIGCIMDATQVRCDIAERDWAAPPRPSDCPVDYGQGIVLDAGGFAQWVCAGDTALAGGPPLAFGDSVGRGDLYCDSAEAGVTCRDSATGHGFSIARQGFTMF